MATEDDDSGGELKLNAGSWYFPKLNKERPKGEDAHFISSDKNTIGVADGVGAWSKQGVDAGKFSRFLMLHAQILAEKISGDYVPPLRVLDMACRLTTDAKILGSSTACIISLNDDLLEYGNLGDSGLMVFRDKEMIHRSPVQQHSFNCPYQAGGSFFKDDPRRAYGDEVAVQEGDIVVAGTDGLFDNMFPSEIWKILEQYYCEEPKILASRIAVKALNNSCNPNYDSPHAQAAREAGVEHVLGGKVDDITVIVAKVELGTPISPHKDPELGFNIKPKDLLKLERSLTIHGVKETVREDHRYNLVEESAMLLFLLCDNQPIKVIESESSLKPILSAAEVPVCVRGTYIKKMESILKSGLNRNRRSHVHFSCSPPNRYKVISGMGEFVDALIYLDIEKALEEGMELYIREDGVILTEGFDGVVPVKFFERIESWPQGEPIVFEAQPLVANSC